VPAELVAVIEQLMAKSPADRFASATDAEAKLLRWAVDAKSVPVARAIPTTRPVDIELTAEDIWDDRAEPTPTVKPIAPVPVLLVILFASLILFAAVLGFLTRYYRG
jgi:hypothetical protein